MTINNRIVQVPAIDGFRSSPLSYYGTAAVAGAAGGPAGSASMLFFALIYPTEFPGSSVAFGRTNAANAGWSIIATSSGQIAVRVFTPANVSVVTAGSVLTLEGLNAPYLILGSYTGGLLSGWANGVSMGAPAAGAGFASFAGPTVLGIRSSTAVNNWTQGPLSDSGLLDTYDVGTFVSTMFGNGGPGLSAMWLEDLRQGRYLTWPRAAVANSDWYWAGRDVVVGVGTLPSFNDRYSATPMLKFGQPQGASFLARAM